MQDPHKLIALSNKGTCQVELEMFLILKKYKDLEIFCQSGLQKELVVNFILSHGIKREIQE